MLLGFVFFGLDSADFYGKAGKGCCEYPPWSVAVDVSSQAESSLIVGGEIRDMPGTCISSLDIIHCHPHATFYKGRFVAAISSYRSSRTCSLIFCTSRLNGIASNVLPSLWLVSGKSLTETYTPSGRHFRLCNAAQIDFVFNETQNREISAAYLPCLQWTAEKGTFH